MTLRADLLPLMISSVTPDAGGTGDDEHRWVTVDIEGASFKAGALVKLTRPGVAEIEPTRWQVLDATRIRAVFERRFSARAMALAYEALYRERCGGAPEYPARRLA